MNCTASSLVLAVALVSLAPPAPARAAAGPARGVRFRAGLWEIVTSSEGANARSATTRRCFTPEQVKVANGSQADILAATRVNEATVSLQQKGCKVSELRLVGDEITETIECPAYVLTDVTTYLPGDRFDNTWTMMPKQGPPRRLHRKAHRVGDCTK
jgi:uncharacterized protein DUF3617